jgi:hypothetical protein
MIRGRCVARMGNQEVCREKRTNRDLGPPVRLAPHRAMRRGCARRSSEEHLNDSAVDLSRQEVFSTEVFSTEVCEGRR